MKLRKKLRRLAARIKAWEQTIQNGKANGEAFKKPGSMKG